MEHKTYKSPASLYSISNLQTNRCRPNAKST